MTYIFDACALIAFLAEEQGMGYEAVNDLFIRADTGNLLFYINIVNLTEVYYHFIRRDGMTVADEIMRGVEALPITIIDTIGSSVYRETARIKGGYSMSLADAFLCATAKNLNAVIVTKDHEGGPDPRNAP
jgi:predicted nucleic acid-binding protein